MLKIKDLFLCMVDKWAWLPFSCISSGVVFNKNALILTKGNRSCHPWELYNIGAILIDKLQEKSGGTGHNTEEWHPQTMKGAAKRHPPPIISVRGWRKLKVFLLVCTNYWWIHLPPVWVTNIEHSPSHFRWLLLRSGLARTHLLIHSG